MPRTVYGLEWEDDVNDLQIELDCYLHNHGSTDGGQGGDRHLRNALWLAYPGAYGPNGENWHDWPELMVWAFCKYKVITVAGHSRAGKCLGEGTPVMLYDGTVLPIEQVKTGMQLMGDDSTPRTVRSTTTGIEKMYRVIPSHGDPWVCNESHILSLKASCIPTKMVRRLKEGRHLETDFEVGDVRDVPLTDFLDYGYSRRQVWKQYRVGVEFPRHEDPLKVDPYIFGAWIGDGDTARPCLTSLPGPVADYWEQYWLAKGYQISHLKRFSHSKCTSINVTFGRRRKKARSFFLSTLVDGKKRIPYRYLTGSRSERMELLAGIIDTDGTIDKKSMSVTTKLSGLANDYLFLARSLGFGATKSTKTARSQSGYECEVYVVHIKGHCEVIPTKLKRCPPRTSRNDPLVQSLTIEPLGLRDYYGVELDGNCRYLLGDFTVTHNTHDAAHIVMLDYMADPLNTITTLTTVTLNGLRDRLFADARSAAIPFGLYITTHNYKIRPTKGQEKFSIEGVATSKDQQAAGRIQGNHAPRRRLVIDEAQVTPSSIYKAMANLMTAPDFRAFILANPEERLSPFGEWSEPEHGWETVADGDNHYPTKKGHIHLSFDGLQSPNIREGKRRLYWMIDQEYIDSIATAYGTESVEFYAYVRGKFPPDGLVAKVITHAHLLRSEKKLESRTPTFSCAALDPAFGGDRCVLHRGEYGAIGKDRYILNYLESIEIKFDARSTDPIDYQIKDQVKAKCEEWEVVPEDYIQDMTGNGRGVLAILQKNFGRECRGVEFGGKATDRQFKTYQDDKAADVCSYFIDELWWAARCFMEEGMIGGVPMGTDLAAELSGRRYSRGAGKKIRLESKDDYKVRMGASPDHADAFVLLVELMRQKGALAGREADGSDPTNEQVQKSAIDIQNEDTEEQYAYAEDGNDYLWPD